MAQEWFWTRDQQRFGPVTSAELVGHLRSGTVVGTDLVWTGSMAEPRPAASVPSVAKYLPAVETAAAFLPVETAPASVGYYNPAGSLPPRAAQTLLGFAPPTGDVAEWPLDDLRVSQFRDAFQLRQAVLSSANLFKLMFVLTLLAAVCYMIAALFGFVSGRPSQQQTALVMLILTVVSAGFCVLYGMAWKATIKCRRWAPITMTALLSISVGVSLISFVYGVAMGNSRDTGGIVLAGVFVVAIGGAFVFVSSKAIFAIPKYLAMPAWCQELLATKTA